MNVCGAVQNIDTAVPEVQLIECVLWHDTTIFLQKQIVETSLSGPLLAKWMPKQNCIVVPLPSNIMEVKNKKPNIGVKIEL